MAQSDHPKRGAHSPLKQLQSRFFGLNTEYPLATGANKRRIYLDSSASSLMLEPAWRATEAFLAHYANTHTSVHTGAKITADTMAWAQRTVLDFVGAPTDEYVALFLGSGTTAVANRVASGLAQLRPERDMVLVSLMEHHSNDLPHRRHARHLEHIPLEGEGAHPGAVSISALKQLLEHHQGRINYIAVTGVSNVTGIANPLKEIAALAHAHDAYLVVDGAQMTAHAPIDLAALDIDAYMFSGHKIYAPGSPGVLIAKRSLLSAMTPNELGGGMVSAVTRAGYDLAEDLNDREQAGTPNIVGTVLLANALSVLNEIGMQEIAHHEQKLTTWAISQLKQCQSIRIYGDQQQARRGSLSFNLANIGHGLTAAILNDYHGIAVRNQCFCAHPYVQSMLMEEFLSLDTEQYNNEELSRLLNSKRGMVRASFGLYTTQEDIQTLTKALLDIEKHIDHYRPLYIEHDDGSYQHKTFHPDTSNIFNPAQTIHKLCAVDSA